METFETNAGDVKIIASNTGSQLAVWLPGQVHPRRFNCISATTPERIYRWLKQNAIDVDAEEDLIDVKHYCERYRQEHLAYDDYPVEAPKNSINPAVLMTGHVAKMERVCQLLSTARVLIDEAARMMNDGS